MLVKKKNPEWQPSENPQLRVGETIEITDPKTLILNGDVIGLAADGVTELSGYELYGVMAKDELDGYQEYLKLQKAQQTQAQMQKEQEELKAQIVANAVAATPAPAPVTPEPAPVTPEPVAPAPVVEEKKVEPKKGK